MAATFPINSGIVAENVSLEKTVKKITLEGVKEDSKEYYDMGIRQWFSRTLQDLLVLIIPSVTGGYREPG